MIGALNSRLSTSPDFIPSGDHCIVSLGKILYFQSASPPDVNLGTGWE